jgi:hypothetical protein
MTLVWTKHFGGWGYSVMRDHRLAATLRCRTGTLLWDVRLYENEWPEDLEGDVPFPGRSQHSIVRTFGSLDAAKNALTLILTA